MENLIFGKTWKEIQAMQQGTYKPNTVDLSKSGKPLATKEDIALLEQYEVNGLIEIKFFGVIDRLRNSEILIEK